MSLNGCGWVGGASAFRDRVPQDRALLLSRALLSLFTEDRKRPETPGPPDSGGAAVPTRAREKNKKGGELEFAAL
ncbi:MAG: hypothetical protein ABSF97_03385 [Candidatus Sulfotelmatobacter sp.]|jgi:hypothetical protein